MTGAPCSVQLAAPAQGSSWHIAAPEVCDGKSAVGESRHRIQGASVRQPTEPCLSEQISARLRELHIRSALVQHEPAALDRQLEGSTVFGRRCALPKQKRGVDLLDGNSAILHGLDAVGDLQEVCGLDIRSLIATLVISER
jgi:hypothetical protein